MTIEYKIIYEDRSPSIDTPSQSTANNGLVMDSGITPHVNNIVSPADFHLMNIASSNDYFTLDAALILVHGIKTHHSRLKSIYSTNNVYNINISIKIYLLISLFE